MACGLTLFDMGMLMSDYNDLIERLRKLWHNEDLNLEIHYEAANALEAQAKQIEELHNQAAMNGRLLTENAALRERIACLEAPLCIGETTIRILAKEGAKVFKNGQGLVAADELFKQDPYERIAELEAALKEVLADIADYEQTNNLYPNPGRSDCWQSVTAARKALEKVND